MLKALARRLLGWVGPAIVNRPWLAQAARGVMRRFPRLRLRVHRLLAPPIAIARREAGLSPVEARVLADLREAIADRQEAKP